MDWRAWLREPLVLFAGLGAVVFALHAWLGDDVRQTDGDGDPIVVDDARRRAIVATRGARTEEEAIDAWLREEVLVREARALGLDREDTIVRRRLAQKMELLIEASVDVAEPTDEELAAALAEDPQYRTPGTVTFEHVFFRRAREDATGDARATLEAHPEAPEDGDPFLLGRAIGPRTEAQLRSSFGDAFTEAIGDAPVDVWAGPIPSAYGAHLVRVTERTEETVPPLDDVRARVRADLERERRDAAVREAIEERVRAAQIEARR